MNYFGTNRAYLSRFNEAKLARKDDPIPVQNGKLPTTEASTCARISRGGESASTKYSQQNVKMDSGNYHQTDI